jgi:hypothetical protein
VGSKPLEALMNEIEARTGAFMPRLVIDTIRKDLSDEKPMQVLADLIEGMADRIDYLERKQALAMGVRPVRRK